MGNAPPVLKWRYEPHRQSSSKEAMPSAEIRQFARTVANPLPRAASHLFITEDTMKMHVAGVSLLIMVMWGRCVPRRIPIRHPLGPSSRNNMAILIEVQPAPGKIRITPDVVRASQQKLTEEGYKPGTPDGKMGPVTRAAIRKYQEHEGLKVTATLDESTAVAFGHRWRQDRG